MANSVTSQSQALAIRKPRVGFLDLPFELREQVYAHLFSDASYYPCGDPEFRAIYDYRCHAYPTLRTSPRSELAEVWENTAIYPKLREVLPAFWRSHRLPHETSEYRSFEFIAQAYTLDGHRTYRLNLSGLLFASHAIYQEAIREYHRHAELTCRSPAELLDLTHRTAECGTAGLVTQVALMIDLMQIFDLRSSLADDPDFLNNDYIQNVKKDKLLLHDWHSLLASAQPNFVTQAFPNLEKLQIHFAYGADGNPRDVFYVQYVYRQICWERDGLRYQRGFMNFMENYFAPKFFGQQQLDVKMNGIDREVGCWMYQGITGTWDFSKSLSEILGIQAVGEDQFDM